MVGGGNQEALNEVVRRVKDFNRRIRDLEEKVRNINARINTIEDTVLEKTKKLNKEISDVNTRTEEVEDRIRNAESEINNLQRRSRKLVTRREFKELEDYLELMNPVESSFMTRQEVEDLIDRKLQKTDHSGDYT